MGHCEKKPQRYFNHKKYKVHPTFWLYFQIFRPLRKVTAACQKLQFSKFVFSNYRLITVGTVMKLRVM